MSGQKLVDSDVVYGCNDNVKKVKFYINVSIKTVECLSYMSLVSVKVG